jgi:hypothetical protein
VTEICRDNDSKADSETWNRFRPRGTVHREWRGFTRNIIFQSVSAGYARSEIGAPGAYPRANTLQLWNTRAFPLLIHTMFGLQTAAPPETLLVDPVLPTWLPELVKHDLLLAGAQPTTRLWRDGSGSSHVGVLHKRARSS